MKNAGAQSDWTWKKRTVGFYNAPHWISVACILCRTCWGRPVNKIFKKKKHKIFTDNLHGGLAFYSDITECCSQLCHVVVTGGGGYLHPDDPRDSLVQQNYSV